MSAPEQPKKRQFWQIHLSTAVILSLFSGLYVLANCSGSTSYDPNLGDKELYLDYEVKYNEDSQPKAYGWPACMVLRSYESFEIRANHLCGSGDLKSKVFVKGALIDLGIFLVFVGFCLTFLEFLIRQREGRKR